MYAFFVSPFSITCNRAGESLNVVPGDGKFRHSPRLKTDQLSPNFVTVNNTKFPDTVTNTVADITAIKTVLFTR